MSDAYTLAALEGERGAGQKGESKEAILRYYDKDLE